MVWLYLFMSYVMDGYGGNGRSERKKENDLGLMFDGLGLVLRWMDDTGRVQGRKQ